MILRLILVGLVTSMGFELPSSRDVSSWVDSSRAWAYVRSTDRMGSSLPVATLIAPGAYEVDPDQAFRVAQGGTLADFRAAEATVDSLPLAAEPTHDSPATVEVVEGSASGLSDGEEMAVASLLADTPPVLEPTTLLASRSEHAASTACEDPAPAIVDELADMAESFDASAAELDASPSRNERLATAVRLTREAAQAWASLIDEPAAAEANDSSSIDAR